MVEPKSEHTAPGARAGKQRLHPLVPLTVVLATASIAAFFSTLDIIIKTSLPILTVVCGYFTLQQLRTQGTPAGGRLLTRAGLWVGVVLALVYGVVLLV